MPFKNMPKIIILRGNSASGKSTIAKALQKSIGPGTMLISQDAIRRDMLYVKDRPHNQSIPLLHNLVTFAAQHSPITILEGIFYREIYEDLFASIADLYGDNIHAYYFDLSFEETLQRHAQKPIATEIAPATLRDWWREKDYLHHITEKMLDSKMSKDDIVKLILNDIKMDIRPAKG